MHQNRNEYRIHNVEKDYQKLFQGLEIPSVPLGLRDSVLARIDREMRYASSLRLALLVPFVFIASAVAVTSFQYLSRETAQSGFSEYLSILFSDGSSILLYWREFLISIAETTPILGMALFLGAVIALAGSLKATFKNIQVLFPSVRLAN